MSEDWSWYNQEMQDDIVIKPVSATAIYRNEKGDIVIRQQGDMGEDDSVIIIPLQHVKPFLNAIATEADIILNLQT